MNNKILPFLLLLILVSYSCTTELGNNCDSGSGEIEKRSVTLDPISRIDLGISGELFIQEGPQSIEIEAPSDIIDRILNEAVIDSEKWILEIDGCYDGPKIKIWATLPKFFSLDITGSGDIVTLDSLRNVTDLNLAINGSGNLTAYVVDAGRLKLEIKGSGDIDVAAQKVVLNSLDIEGSGDINLKFSSGQTCRTHIKGSGDILIEGTVSDNIITIEGQGNVMAFDLFSQNCIISAKGSGNCHVTVSDNLNINLEGSGDICYKGQPSITTDIIGSGKLRDCN